MIPIDDRRKIVKMAFLGFLIALISFPLLYISDNVILESTIISESGVLQNNEIIPENVSRIIFVKGYDYYKTYLIITGNRGYGVVSNAYKESDRVTFLFGNKTESYTIARYGALPFEVLNVTGNIHYNYTVIGYKKPYQFLILFAFVTAILGNTIVLVSIYKLLVIRQSKKA